MYIVHKRTCTVALFDLLLANCLSNSWSGKHGARPYPALKFCFLAQDITPQYDDGLGYWTADIPEGAPTVAANPGNTHAIPYPATWGHRYQFEHQC
jgi:hypothetical protein